MQILCGYPTAVKVWRNKSRRYKQQYNTKMRAIIFHYGLFKIIWDWFVLLLVLYTAIEVPFLVCFINNKGNPLTEKSGLNNLIVVDICVDMFFFCDIIVNFRTTYIEKNDALITNPKMIAIRYLRTYFIVDLVAAVPWDLIYLNQTTRESTSLSLLKTVRLLRLFQAARRLDQNYEKSVSLLFLMVFVFTLVAHWLACIWYYIGLSEARVDSPTWLSMLADQIRQPFNGSDLTTGPSLRSRYLTSLYFTLTCITSVGFGNVSPNTDWEKLFTIISMLIGGLLFAAVFGNVSAIIYGHYSGTFKFRERMQSVKYFLAYHKIKGPLALKVKDYSRHLWTQTKGISTAKVMKQFPQSLQEEINSYLHFNVIRDCPLFEHAEESCLWSLAVRMVQLNHLPNNTIVRQGTVVNSVYIIKRGRLDVLRNGAVVGKIGEGVAFGNLSIELHGPVPKSAVTLRSNTFVDIHILHLKDLKELLELYPEFKQELIRKTTTILKKTVLTSQILSSWDALEVENSGARSNGLTFVSTWITRQKSKRNCNVTKSKEHGYVSRKKKHINETLVNLPLVVLSPMCASNDDAQQYWRFANIIESRDNENGESSEENSVSKKHNCVNEEKDTLVESTVSADEKQYLSAEESEVCEGEKEYLETNIDDVVNLHNCDSKDSHCMNNDDTKYEKLELSVQDICKKLETLERKMDLILNYLENQTQTTVV